MPWCKSQSYDFIEYGPHKIWPWTSFKNRRIMFATLYSVALKVAIFPKPDKIHFLLFFSVASQQRCSQSRLLWQELWHRKWEPCLKDSHLLQSKFSMCPFKLRNRKIRTHKINYECSFPSPLPPYLKICREIQDFPKTKCWAKIVFHCDINV